MSSRHLRFFNVFGEFFKRTWQFKVTNCFRKKAVTFVKKGISDFADTPFDFTDFSREVNRQIPSNNFLGNHLGLHPILLVYLMFRNLCVSP